MSAFSTHCGHDVVHATSDRKGGRSMTLQRVQPSRGAFAIVVILTGLCQYFNLGSSPFGRPALGRLFCARLSQPSVPWSRY